MISIALVDDELIQLKLLSSYITEWSVASKNLVDVKTFTSSEAFLFNGNTFDIAVLDIQMNGKSGIELAHEIRKADANNTAIVFVTGVSDYITEGYEVSALHYLLKPVKKEKLFEVLDKAVSNINNSKAEKFLFVSTEDGNVRVPLKNILYIEVFAHTIEIHTKTKCYITKSSLSALEYELDESFVRSHRSCIVGVRHINRISKTEVVLDDNILVPLSRRMYSEANQAFIKYFKGG